MCVCVCVCVCACARARTHVCISLVLLSVEIAFITYLIFQYISYVNFSSLGLKVYFRLILWLRRPNFLHQKFLPSTDLTLSLQCLTIAVRVQRLKYSFSRRYWTHPQVPGSMTVVTMVTSSVASSAVSWAVTVTALVAIATAVVQERIARPTSHWACSVWHLRPAGLPWIQRYVTYSQ